MIAIAVVLLSAAPIWVPVGESYSRLRVFVDRTSFRTVDGRRRARVRIGAPGTIVGKIVLAYEDEEFDCASRRWRLLAYEARDEHDQMVRQSTLDPATHAMLPIVDDSIGGAVWRLVCGAPPRPLPTAP